MNSFEFQLLLQILFAASWELNSIVGQQIQQQHFPAPAHYQIQQQHYHHPSSHQQEHYDYRQLSQSSGQSLNHDFQPTTHQFDFDKFNQQAKQLQAQLNFFNQQQQKHIQQQMNSVHQQGSEPQFDFSVNGNYTDLEKASEQFVNLGNLVGKQNVPPKVIKITKTVAIKQPVPVPYPVPIVKLVKEQVPYDFSNHGHQSHQHVPSTTERPSEFKSPAFFNYSSYTNKSPVPDPTEDSEPYRHRQTESYRHHHTSESYHEQQGSPSAAEYDTAPFYITTPQKERIKIVPVPYYVDAEGNKHEVSSQTSNSHDTDSEAFYPSRQTTSAPDGSGKFQSFTFNYHQPPQNAHHNRHPSQYSQQSHNVPDTKYYYNHESDSDKSGESKSSEAAPNFSSGEADDVQQHHQNYQYKYVTYE